MNRILKNSKLMMFYTACTLLSVTYSTQSLSACTANSSPTANCTDLSWTAGNITNNFTVSSSGGSTAAVRATGTANSTFTNNSSGVVSGGTIPDGAIEVYSGRTVSINNYGQITGGYSGLSNSAGGTISTLTNTNLIRGTNKSVINYGLISSINNSGTLTSSNGVSGGGISNQGGGTITLITNSGSINAINAISNFSTIGTLNNTATGTITGDINSSLPGTTIGTITNDGVINGQLFSRGSITTIINTGTIDGSTSSSIFQDNGGAIGTITNTGSIFNSNALADIRNTGVGATITTLNNGQGAGNTHGALNYQGALPANYNVIITSASNYGKLAVTSGTGSTSFGIYTGSTVRNGTYASVLSGVTSSNLAGATSGNYNGFTWRLANSSGSIWDLIVTGASTIDTQQSLANTSSVLQSAYSLQNSVIVNGFTYDCPLFDKHGICVSVGGRNTMVQAQGINNTSGLLIASYRLDKNNSRIGAWVDQNLSVSSPSAVKLSNSTPMIGLFGVWSQRPDGVGAEVKVSGAYGQKDTTITRQIVGTSEAGNGSSQLISQGAQVVGKYGFAVMSDVVVSPYAGVRYTQNNMGGYTEATSSSVTAPLTYSALNTNATTALAGAEARYRGIPKTTLFASAGLETDISSNNGSYLATGVSGLTPVNFNPNPVTTRPTATVGGYYDVLKNQRIGITGIYRQEAYQAVSTTTVLATYTIGL